MVTQLLFKKGKQQFIDHHYQLVLMQQDEFRNPIAHLQFFHQNFVQVICLTPPVL